MTTRSGGRIGFEAAFGRHGRGQGQQSNSVFSVLILSDFSGGARRTAGAALFDRKPRAVNIDNLDKIFGSFGATVKLSMATADEAAFSLDVRSLDDFHPDALMNRIPFLSELLSAKHGLTQPGKLEAAADKWAAILNVAGRSTRRSSTEDNAAESPASKPTESDEATLGRLLGKQDHTAPSTPIIPSQSVVEKLIHQAVDSSGTITPSLPSGIEALTSAADLELSTRLRHILHDPAFQLLETAWRGLDFLIRRCPDEERIRYSVLDATVEEVIADIESFRRFLSDAPPQLLVVDRAFGRTKADLHALGTLGAVCMELGVQLIAEGHPRLAGCDSFAIHPDPDDWREQLSPDMAEFWSSLRCSPVAPCIGLALPRFLLRQPYGKGSDPTDGFGFEEILQTANHEAFLWGNPAFAVAQVLAEVFVAEAQGTDMNHDGEVGELPVFRYTEDGTGVIKPCAEAWLSDRAAETLHRRGLMPVLSIKGHNAVKVATFISIAEQT